MYTRNSMGSAVIEDCHDGKGRLTCVGMFGDYDRTSPGFAFAHDDILEPGTVIGEHMHQGDEEMYFVLEGHGTMIEDGVQHEIRAGDVSITRSGHSHGIINSADGPMRLLVVCTKV